MQGDVIAIVDENAETVARYSYDAWGVCTIVSDNTGIIARVNPFRYRGYYYDADLELYYVCSRYYDPEICRWINADNQIAGVGGDILGYNMFAYCFNNPVNMYDPTGNWPKWAKNLLRQ